MATKLNAGDRLKSAVCNTEIIVVKAPADPVEVSCGGHPMRAHGDGTTPSGEPDPSAAEGTLLGKRYTDESGELEVLCTQPGDGSLACGGDAMAVRAAKPLPSSD